MFIYIHVHVHVQNKKTISFLALQSYMPDVHAGIILHGKVDFGDADIAKNKHPCIFKMFSYKKSYNSF